MIERGSHYLGRMNADMNGRTIRLFSGDFVNVDNKLLPVNFDDLAHVTLGVAADNLQISRWTSSL